MERIFMRPAVAGPLGTKFIESRLHMDWQEHVDEDLAKIHKKLQRELAGSVAMPIYVIVDPKTDTMIEKFTLSDAGSPSKDAWETAFIGFLNRATN